MNRKKWKYMIRAIDRNGEGHGAGMREPNMGLGCWQTEWIWDDLDSAKRACAEIMEQYTEIDRCRIQVWLDSCGKWEPMMTIFRMEDCADGRIYEEG